MPQAPAPQESVATRDSVRAAAPGTQKQHHKSVGTEWQTSKRNRNGKQQTTMNIVGQTSRSTEEAIAIEGPDGEEEESKSDGEERIRQRGAREPSAL
ncbi:hypothetical protein PybrP1_006375 [[Pythium] brassicae (nom. inval.)]|nr:hypothetical protein PybrP1_006375 [[Pythium] brassicae (nom. inval.)]